MNALSKDIADAVAPVCTDPVRKLFHDRLGQFYERTEGEPIVVGTCALCGATGVQVHDKGKGVGPCRAQASMTQKRHSPAEGEMPVFGAKRAVAKRPDGASAIAGEGSYVLIEPERTLYVGNVVAYKPLPEWIVAVRGPNAPRLPEMMKRVLERPSLPYLLIAFGKKADMPLRLTDSMAEVVLNGTAPPVRLDRARMLEIVGLGRRFGVAALKKAIEMKDGLTRPDAAERLAKFEAAHPELAAMLPTIPGSREREKSHALLVVEGEAKAAQAATKEN